MSDTPQRGYLRRTSEGMKPREDLPARDAPKTPATPASHGTAAGVDAPQVTSDAPAQDEEEKLSSSMVIAVSVPDDQAKRDRVLGVLDRGNAGFPRFAKRFAVVGSKPIKKDPPMYRVYLQTDSEGLRESTSEDAGKSLLGEILEASGVTLANEDYITVLLPLADKDNPQSVSACAPNQWTFRAGTPADPPAKGGAAAIGRPPEADASS